MTSVKISFQFSPLQYFSVLYTRSLNLLNPHFYQILSSTRWFSYVNCDVFKGIYLYANYSWFQIPSKEISCQGKKHKQGQIFSRSLRSLDFVLASVRNLISRLVIAREKAQKAQKFRSLRCTRYIGFFYSHRSENLPLSS